MARAPSAHGPDFSDKPLADYFWIAGLDGNDLLDAYRTQIERTDSILLDGSLNIGINETIVEDAAAEENVGPISDSPVASAHHSRQNSYQRLGRLSMEAKSSIRSIDKLSYRPSVRSNGTIRLILGDGASRSTPVPSATSVQDGTSNGIKNHYGARDSKLLSDEDFDDAMKRFTSDRDAFNLSMDFKNENDDSSPKRTKSKPQARTQRIVAEELDTLPGRAIGSVRRHMSIREMNSTKRQPSVVARHMSTRTARRMSSYSSVMPRPQPLAIAPDEHPLKRTFEPALLDRYPRRSQTTELKRRGKFPAFVPMFAFPNDINIVPSDARPPSTWHELQFTNDDNEKAHAVCVIVWISLDRRTADDLEKRCEEWRKAHMSEAERELASSLGERLASERANLSRLLLNLPSAESGSSYREALEEQIAKVEDKIALMSDMLKPLRHGAASRIEGLTHGDTGLWIPRAYGVIGPDQAMVCFWKEWLKAVVVPMMDGSVLHVPASSPRVGVWQPLERYVHLLCTKAPRPLTSRVQVEVAVRDIKLYAKREAKNELPGTRTCDLYPLFRALTIPNIMALFEYVLTEQRIIFVSAYPAMLKLASNAIMSLIWPLMWQGVHIPVVPSRLMEVVDAPVPYIIGIVRTSDKLALPEQDDFVMVDLDKNEIHATEQPLPLPKQQRRKLMSLLYLAAPHHTNRGVPEGVPSYATNTFATDMFASENTAVHEPITPAVDLQRLASISSTYFGPAAVSDTAKRAPILNAYLHAKPVTMGGGMDRPGTATTTVTARRPSRTGSEAQSPITTKFPQPTTPQSRNDSGYALQTSLREKRSGQFDSWSRRAPSISNVRRKASLPFVKHNATMSNTSDFSSFRGTSTYAPSVDAQSTLAASTVLPGIKHSNVRNTEGTAWIEGHCMQLRGSAMGSACAVCYEKSEESHYRCADCPLATHDRCLEHICIPCQSAFYPNQIRAAFARFFASLFYNYHRFLRSPDAAQRRQGLVSSFDVDSWIRSVPSEHGEYLSALKQTQAFDQFVVERETQTSSQSSDIALFDAFLATKKQRSRGVRSSIAVSLSGRNPFAGRSPSGGVSTEYLADTATHTWRVVPTPHSLDRPELGPAAKGRDYRSIVSRAPAKLEDDLFPPATAPQTNDVPAVPPLPVHILPVPKRNGLRHRMNGLSMHAP